MIAAGLARPRMRTGRPRDFFFDRRDVSDHRSRAAASSRSARARWQPMPSPNTSTPARPRSFPRAICSTISPPRAPPRSRRGTIILAEGYMDVIALVRAGFDARRGAARHRAHRRSAAACCGAPRPNRSWPSTATMPGLQRGASRRASGAAASEGRAIRCASRSCRRAKIRTPSSRTTAPAAMKKLLDEAHAAVAGAVAGRNRRQGFLHARTPRRPGAHAGGNRRRDRRWQDRRLLPPRFRAAGVREPSSAAHAAPAASERRPMRRPLRQRGTFRAPVHGPSRHAGSGLAGGARPACWPGRAGGGRPACKEMELAALLLEAPGSGACAMGSCWPNCPSRTLRLTGCATNS